MAGTYLFGATLLYKINSSTSARMRGRLVLNGTTEIRGTIGEISGAHTTMLTPPLAADAGFGRPRSTDLREVMNAIFSMATTGCQWRMLPKDLPPPSTV